MRALIWIGVLGYPPPRVDHRFKDGDTVRVGPIALTAHITAGHTRGCTSWSFPPPTETGYGACAPCPSRFGWVNKFR